MTSQRTAGGGRKLSKHQTKSKKAGLEFPVGRIGRFLKRGRFAKRVGVTAPIFLAAVLEYLCAELLEGAGSQARDDKKVRIIPRHIQLAVHSDEALSKFVGQATIASGGVLPNLHSVLLPKVAKKKIPVQSQEF
ncbi:histone H2AX [Cardiosporidium cionae]|uniref:Histone H2A n=1 Tax=Cardiosporidium cionae TaxID=476202 RepID=A0ABQ7J6P2_9APIC|nr:histone H2AX [Cardiosporidium cionae]|eukprot:KAF8819665.1 histone H2AX [Cardiosporidium cionae]